jgi:hypothetical protein
MVRFSIVLVFRFQHGSTIHEICLRVLSPSLTTICTIVDLLRLQHTPVNTGEGCEVP